MLGSTRRGFNFWKISIPGISGHAHFEEIALLLIFGPSVSPFLEEGPTGHLDEHFVGPGAVALLPSRGGGACKTPHTTPKKDN